MNEKFAIIFDNGAWFLRSRDAYGYVRQVAGPCPTMETVIVEAALHRGGRIAIELVTPE